MSLITTVAASHSSPRSSQCPPTAMPSRPALPSRREALLAGSVLLAASAPSTLRAAQAGTAAQSGDGWSSPGLATVEDDLAPKFFKTASGVGVQELASGSGPAAARGDRVTVDYVLRRSNGYFIYSTVEGVSSQPQDVPTGPVLLTLDDAVTVPGLVEALEGMQVGGKRRILVPASAGWAAGAGQAPQMPTFATRRQLDNHRKESLLFEILLRRVNSSKS